MRRQAAFWLPLLAIGALLSPRPFAAIVGASMFGSYAALLQLVARGRRERSEPTRGADRITALRLVAVASAVLASAYAGEVTLVIWCGLCAATLADLADGWWARRFGSSPEGAVLDMEADQLATVALSVLAWRFQATPPYVLLLPAFRYSYVLLMSARGFSVHDPKPLDGDNRRAKLICAVVMGILLALTFPHSLGQLRAPLVVAGIALFAASYASDIVQLARRAG